MSRFLMTATFVLLAYCCFAQHHIVGKWKTVDDTSGEAKSIVEISERDGKFYGKIIKLYLSRSEDQDPVCTKCDPGDSRYQKKIMGMEILRDLKPEGNEYSEGNILDPEIGKVYRCKVWLEEGDLKIRGYWGPFYRTQTWKKAT